MLGYLPWLAPVVLLTVLYLMVIGPTLDLRADRLVALATLDGLDPYVPVRQLAVQYGSDLSWSHVHPRTPGALVLQLPLVVIPEAYLDLVSAMGTAVAITATAAAASKLLRLSMLTGVLLAVGIGVTSVAVESATVGSQSPLVAWLLVWAWWKTRDGDEVHAGLALGLAVTLKLFPWLVMVALMRLRRTTIAAAGTVIGLNGIGLAFPGVSLRGAFEAVSSANLSRAAELNAGVTRFLSSSLSIEGATFILAVIGFAASAGIARARWDLNRTWIAALALSLLVSPLLWRHYLLALVPSLFWLWARGGFTGRVVAVAGGVWFFLPDPLIAVRVAVVLIAAVAVFAMSPLMAPAGSALGHDLE